MPSAISEIVNLFSLKIIVIAIANYMFCFFNLATQFFATDIMIDGFIYIGFSQF